MKAILIYSGGLDSTTLLYEYKDEISLAVTFDYGAKHGAREIECAKYNCNKLGIKHLIIPLDFMGKYFRSNLLESGGEIPEGNYDEENMRSTVVPFRNGIMLAVAAGLAESYDLDTVLLANHSGDHSIYPDCRPSFIEAFDSATKEGTYNGVRVVSPYCNITKRDIALRGRELGIDYSKTYSCYKGGEVHCGCCGTCRERKEALEGFDPTVYEK
ncbi:MAG: 7-cyano-7-deazaguanine synthase QueC [Bacteroidales bacterium]|nr:7-cyano-7-deazaguanine synthase QueC [Bacteroidales bacterium]MBQ3846767.1 7-cyano-7-deazaguanine synthase QueC [Bacteroidales bacterium]